MPEESISRALLAASLATQAEGVKLSWRESGLTCRWQVPEGTKVIVGKHMLGYLTQCREKAAEIQDPRVREIWLELVDALLSQPELPFSLQRVTWLMRVAESPHRTETNVDAWNLYLWNLHIAELPEKVAVPMREKLGNAGIVDIDTAATTYHTFRTGLVVREGAYDGTTWIRPRFELLRQFRNLLLTGVPGCGKTETVRSIARSWQALSGRPLAAFVTLVAHPQQSYESYIERRDANAAAKAAKLSPQVVGGLGQPAYFFDPAEGIRDGLLLRAIAEAARQPDKDVLVLIDGFEPADARSRLAEVLPLLDARRRVRWGRHDGAEGWQLDDVGSQVVELAYSGRQIFVPDNFFLVATLKQGGRVSDEALPGPFAYDRSEALDGEALRDALLRTRPLVERVRIEDYMEPTVMLFTALNQVLREELGVDGKLGPAPLFSLADSIAAADDHLGAMRALLNCWKTDILPKLVARLAFASAFHLIEPGARLSHLIEQSWLRLRFDRQGQGPLACLRIVSR